MTAPPFDRADNIERLATGEFDVLVVGGGITGAGVALDAAGRGLRVALVDKGDLASGTSSKSSKLAHGGLRYLQQGDIRLVYEALHERQRLLRNAPHLVRPLPFLIPVMAKGGVVNRKVGWALGKAMWLYDLTGGARIGKLHRRLGRDDTLAHLPTMPADRLAYGYLYHDAQVDDARLTLAVARTAAALGAVVVTYAPVTALRRDGSGRVAGATVTVDDRPIEVRARIVVNATGVWTDALLGLAEPGRAPTMRPAKGVHLTVPWDKVRNDVAVVIPVPKDRRSLFLVPWLPRGDGTYELTYVGTTDTDYDGPLDDPACTADDVAYVLRALNASVTTGVTEADVVATWAGLRPLVAGSSGTRGSARTADLSRRHLVATDAAGVVTVTGGKLTTYRRMAADGVDEVLRGLGERPRRRRSRTARQALVGATRSGDVAAPDHLDRRYGTEADAVRALAAKDPRLAEPLVPGLPYLAAEAVWAVRGEMATTLADVLDRRTRARLQDANATAAAAEDVARLVATDLGWDEGRVQREAAQYRASIAAEREDAGLPALGAPRP